MTPFSKATLTSSEGLTLDVLAYIEPNKITLIPKSSQSFILFNFNDKLTILTHNQEPNFSYEVSFVEIKILNGKFYYIFKTENFCEIRKETQFNSVNQVSGTVRYNSQLDHCHVEHYSSTYIRISTNSAIPERNLLLSFKSNKQQIHVKCKIAWHENINNVHKYGLYSIKR